MSLPVGTPEALARRIFAAAVAAVRPENLVRNSLNLAGELLTIGDRRVSLRPGQKIRVFGSGKASVAMARAVEGVLGDRIDNGLVIGAYPDPEPLQRIQVLRGDHPVPAASTLAASAALWQAMTSLGEEDFFLFLLSGGSSALLELPLAPLTLAELQQVTRLLLGRSVPIEAVNTVRKHLSRLKGGRLGAAIRASGAVLVLSDVIGDDFATIGSGPLYCDASTFADARAVLEEYGVRQEMPANARLIIEEGCEGRRSDTPKDANPRLSHHLIGSNRHALVAAKQQAEQEGMAAHIMTSRLYGEAREVARELIALARKIQESGRPFAPPVVLLFGGETTVTVTGRGRGGRNQELALAALLAIGDTADIRLLAAGTDGIDGNTEAAGAVVEAVLWRQARAQGFDPAAYLADNDSHPFFAQAGGLVVTGPTGTNVMDIVILIIDPKETA